MKKKKNKCLNCGNPCVNKYCSVHCQQIYQQLEWEKKWFAGEESGDCSAWGEPKDRIRTYLFRINNNQCSRCGWGEVNPYTNTIPLEVEHIDGDYHNNRPENLTLLCPNCHSLTATYRGANKGHGRGKTWIPKIE